MFIRDHMENGFIQGGYKGYDGKNLRTEVLVGRYVDRMGFGSREGIWTE